jgi:iron complex outermembrane receptor protein
MMAAVYKVVPIVLAASFLFNAKLAHSDVSEAAKLAAMETIIVTATRQELNGIDLGQSWSKLEVLEVEQVDLQHSNQLFNRVSGAWVSRGNGQESLISLRSPVLTGAGACGAFFTGEDGINLRAPGFCNVNQLFDANLLQAGGVEVLKGPSTAVFGSNAMHGVINVLTKSAEQTTPALGVQYGSRDFVRTRVAVTNGGLALNAHGTSYGGYQSDSGYDQQKATLRFDGVSGDWNFTSVVSAANLNQETAGYIQDGKGAYEDDAARRVNRNPEAYRDARSVRAYLKAERELNGMLLSVTPYVRSNEMAFLQHYLPWKSREMNKHHSVGVQMSLSGDTSLGSYVAGIDLDITDGALKEDQAEDFSPNQPSGIHYDYDVDARNLGVFGQFDLPLSDNVSLQAGIRGERTDYDYTTGVTAGSACAATASNCRFYRPENRSDDFSNWSGNLSLVWSQNQHRYYVRTARGFRAPQATELYRLQAGQIIADIDSEEMRSIDVGWRYQSDSFSSDLSLYAMDKDDVIFQDRDRQNVSGASTAHRGIDIDLFWALTDRFSAALSASLGDHSYDSDILLLGSRDSIRGNDIDTSPRHFGSARLTRALTINERPASIELEAVWIDAYYLDPNNQHEYEGHELLNLRFSWSLTEQFKTTWTFTNLLDEGYAERADYGFGNYRYFVGEPRSAMVGVYYEF